MSLAARGLRLVRQKEVIWTVGLVRGQFARLSVVNHAHEQDPRDSIRTMRIDTVTNRKNTLVVAGLVLLLCSVQARAGYGAVNITTDTTLTADQVCTAGGVCVQVSADNIKVNGRGFAVDCGGVAGSIGVQLVGLTGVHLLNLEVRNCTYGVRVEQPGGVAAVTGLHSLNNLYVHDIGLDCIVLASGFINGPGFTRINDSRVELCGRWGIVVSESRGNKVNGNTVSRSYGGILVENLLCGAFLPGCEGNQLVSNDVSGNGIFGIRLSYANNITVRGNVANNMVNGVGISVAGGSDNNTVRSNQADNNLHGILLYSLGPVGIPNPDLPDFNRVQGNTINHNTGDGIGVEGSTNLIRGNTAASNGTDLHDYNAACHVNTWRGNTFASATPADCIR